MSFPWNTGGYTCSGCGGWVQNGSIHSCIGRVAPLPMPVDAVAMALGRIEALLQQILKKLDA